MAQPIKHAESSARKFGGKPEDYLPLHNWLALIWTVERFEDHFMIEGIVSMSP